MGTIPDATSTTSLVPASSADLGLPPGAVILPPTFGKIPLATDPAPPIAPMPDASPAIPATPDFSFVTAGLIPAGSGILPPSFGAIPGFSYHLGADSAPASPPSPDARPSPSVSPMLSGGLIPYGSGILPPSFGAIPGSPYYLGAGGTAEPASSSSVARMLPSAGGTIFPPSYGAVPGFTAIVRPDERIGLGKRIGPGGIPIPPGDGAIAQDDKQNGHKGGAQGEEVYASIESFDTLIGETRTIPGAKVSTVCYDQRLILTILATGSSSTVPLFKGFPKPMWGNGESVEVRVYYGSAKANVRSGLDVIGLLFGLLITGTKRKITIQQVCWWEKTESFPSTGPHSFYNSNSWTSELGESGFFAKDAGGAFPCQARIDPKDSTSGDVKGAVEVTKVIGPGQFWIDFPSASTNLIASDHYVGNRNVEAMKIKWDMNFNTWVYLDATAIGFISWGYFESYLILPSSGKFYEREIKAGTDGHEPQVVSRFNKEFQEEGSVGELYGKMQTRKVLK